MDINKLIVSGRLTMDAETKTVGEDSSILTKGSIAFGGQNKDHSNFINFVMWGEYGKTMSQYMKKGTPICLDGRLRQDRWESTEGNRSNYVLEVQNVILLGSKTDRSASEESDTISEPKAVKTKAKSKAKEITKEGIEKVPF